MTGRSLRQALRSPEAQEAGELIERRGTGDSRWSLSDLGRWASDPVGFVRDVLGEEPWSRQVEIAEAVRDEPLVTVRSCHAAGKDWLAARLALWWVYARRGLVLLTGPTASQVEEILMRGELRDAFRGSGLPGDLHVKALRPGGAGKVGILAKTATGVSALTGFHEVRVLFIITEAQDPEIGHAWDAAFACTTGAGDRILTLGNPTEPGGRFCRAHQPDSDWHVVKIAAEDIPNVRQGSTVVPGLLTEEGVDRFAAEYGKNSAFYQARVGAEFPAQASDALVRRDWVEAAFERHEEGTLAEEAEDASTVVAVDVARFGRDRSVLCVRRGPQVLGFTFWQGEDTQETARRVHRAVERLHEQGEGPVETVVVDVVGVGSGVADKLDETLSEITWQVTRGRYRHRLRTRSPRLEEFRGGKAALLSEQYRNLRSQAFWHVRKRLEEGEIALPPDEGLRRELVAIRAEVTPDGRVAIESKEAIKRRLGGESPDRADALSMSFLPDLEDGKPTISVVW